MMETLRSPEYNPVFDLLDRYAREDIFRSDEYAQAKVGIGLDIDPSSFPIIDVERYLKMGIEIAATRIRLMWEMEDPVKRRAILARSDSENRNQLSGKKLMSIAFRNKKIDPSGTIILQALRLLDVVEISKEAENQDPKVTARIRYAASLVGIGEDLVLNKHRILKAESLLRKVA